MFKSRNYNSEETYDIGKFLNFDTDVYDVLNSQLLMKIKSLPVNRYYNTTNGYRDLDIISSQIYGDPFFAYYIQFYNDISEETVPEGTVLKLFSLTDFTTLCNTLMIGDYNIES